MARFNGKTFMSAPFTRVNSFPHIPGIRRRPRTGQGRVLILKVALLMSLALRKGVPVTPHAPYIAHR
jgi:hypothetical protein